MTPPRPTVHKLRSLDAKILKAIDDINRMTQGDTIAGDAQRLEKLRVVRRHMLEGRLLLEVMIDDAT